MFRNMGYLQLDDQVSNDKDNEDVQVDAFMTMNVNVLDTNDLYT